MYLTLDDTESKHSPRCSCNCLVGHYPSWLFPKTEQTLPNEDPWANMPSKMDLQDGQMQHHTTITILLLGLLIPVRTAVTKIIPRSPHSFS